MVSRTEAALLRQITCGQPPRPAHTVSAMLRDRLIRRTEYGEDGIEIYVPTQRLKLMGFGIVRIAGWQEGAHGGAAPPFTRLPGTAPTTHIAVTLRGPVAAIHRALEMRGVKEAAYVPNPADPSGGSRQRTEGPLVSPEDYQYGVHPKLSGVVTLECE